MDILLGKLNYRDQKRIAVINADEYFLKSLAEELRDVQVDTEIDKRYPYEFALIFVRHKADVELLAPVALHNLTTDGILWFAYPKKTSKKYLSEIDRDHGWEALLESGFHRVRQVSVNEDWSALRFRNIKFIKAASGRT